MKKLAETHVSAAAIVLLIVMATIGCDENERLAQMATEAADRQAKQNEEMARLNREVAEGTKRLVESEADARKGHTEMQQELTSQQVDINQQRDALEIERRQIASQRLIESRLGPILKASTIGLMCIVTVGFCWYLLFGLKQDDGDQALNELLIEDLASDHPRLLPRLAAVEPSRLSDDSVTTEEHVFPD